jgi:hypothetical protein
MRWRAAAGVSRCGQSLKQFSFQWNSTADFQETSGNSFRTIATGSADGGIPIRKMKEVGEPFDGRGPCYQSSGNLQNFVIVHELLHVSVPNHGKLWKSRMRAYIEDWEILEVRLNRRAVPYAKSPPTGNSG